MASANVVVTNLTGSYTDIPEVAAGNFKRKRDDVFGEEVYTNGAKESQDDATRTQSEEDFMRDLLDVLKVEDPVISILSRPLPVTTSSSEPQSKKQKSDDEAELGLGPTILSRYAASEYKNVDEILKDIDVLVASVQEELQPRKIETRHQYIAESDQLLKVIAFKDRAHVLMEREKTLRAQRRARGNVVNESNPSTDKRTVLTLYGNAPGPKQLFSSFQHPTDIDGKLVTPTVKESGLPNGISTTHIFPSHTSGVIAGDKSRVKTLGDLFPPPGSLAVVPPPKPSKLSTTRSNTVGWYQPAAKDPSPRAPGYLTQSIAAGQWLDYSKSNVAHDARKKNRERAMSLTNAKVTPPEQDAMETEVSKLDALFRNAYSGFAPSKDHSGAVVSESHVNRIWWQKSGERAYDKLLADAGDLADALGIENNITDTLEELDISKLEELADIDPDTIDPSLVPLGEVVRKSAEERDTEEVLADISDLLETLNSYQRIRHMSLNSARSSSIHSATDNVGTGTPSKPSESEQLTYETLKTSLKLMIETLPPYAVAKLDPDRLAELSISTKIEIAQEEYKGVMDEDEASARARSALAAAASRAPTATPSHRSGPASQMYANQYSAQQGSNSQTYRPNSSHTPIRPPSTNYQRAPATIPAPYQARPNPAPSPAYRPTYTPNYSQQNQSNVRQTQMQYQSSVPYGTANQQYQHSNNPPAYMRSQSQQGYPQNNQNVPQHSVNGSYGRPAYTQQAQPLQNGMNYQYNTNNIPRQASPQKMYSPQPTPSQPRQSSYSTPTPSHAQGPSRPPSYLQNPLPQHHMSSTPSQQSQQPPYQRQQSGSHMNYSTFMTSAEQNNLLERQRAQLAQQQGMQQQAARTAAQPGIGSPSPATNGHYSVPATQ